MPGYMRDPAKVEERAQKWERWWERKQDSPNASKHFETYQRQMERLGRPVMQPSFPTAPAGATGEDRDDDERRGHRGKRK